MKSRYDDIDVFLSDDGFNDLSNQNKKTSNSFNNRAQEIDKSGKGNYSNNGQNPKNPDTEPKSSQFYKIYAEFMIEYGSNAAVIAAIFEAKQSYFEKINKISKGDYFYLEHPKIEQMTHISTHYQKIAIKKLVELQIIHVSPNKKGTPPKTHYRMNIAQYEKILQML